jgi:hypothetical protein
MVDENHNQTNQRTRGEPKLDRALDAALAKYTAVEPRAGLEERIFAHLHHANLQAESTRAANRAWWRMRWGWTAALAIVVVIFIFAMTLTLRSSKPSQPSVKNIPSITIPGPHETKKQEPELANRNENPAPPRRERVRHGVTPQPEAVADADYPKLDKFPSPRPLSGQEKMLLEYVQQNPEEAAMIAQAQTAFARQQELERNAPQPGDANPQMRQQLE